MTIDPCRRPYDYLPYKPGDANGARPDAAEWSGGGVDAYLRAVIDEILPYAERAYGVSADPALRIFGGSSFGGICALCAAVRCPGVFGSLLVESPSLWFADERLLREDLPSFQGPWPARVFLAMGTKASLKTSSGPTSRTDGRTDGWMEGNVSGWGVEIASLPEPPRRLGPITASELVSDPDRPSQLRASTDPSWPLSSSPPLERPSPPRATRRPALRSPPSPPPPPPQEYTGIRPKTPNPEFDAQLVTYAQELADLLAARGLAPGRRLQLVVEEGATHTESAWAGRLPAALGFLGLPWWRRLMARRRDQLYFTVPRKLRSGQPAVLFFNQVSGRGRGRGHLVVGATSWWGPPRRGNRGSVSVGGGAVGAPTRPA